MKKYRQDTIRSYRLEQLQRIPGLQIDVHYIPDGASHPAHHTNADVSKPHRHEFYTLGISGQFPSSHMVDFRVITMPPNSLFLLTPGQVHLVADAVSPSDIFLISFTPDFLPAAAPPLPISMDVPVIPDAADYKEIRHISQQLENEFLYRKALQHPVLQHYLALLLTLFTRCLPERATHTLQPELLQQFRELIEINLRNWTSSGDYARALHVTPGHLNDVVKQHTGQTATALLAARRILEAKRMLLHSDEGIKEIAWYLQFNEVTYFNRFFKQHTGQTPAAFRISSRGMYNHIPE
ncbi:AraC family transcriptional regulator [Chitinophaga nivalis]|uniref:AraC family transcriptional regulator n=1 Tax=Chitinophaga nivalis TaxID=2991709 RepID=A0ABT3IEF4_9BACT|nr:AraC family transcriptional regulator [Chitinophaga nivalis]MCW3467971.1 AraC family transcriptional regulator [Chitinophaga nivalis]MCW3482338.1 AraC family transcriptional regulator [Chitinophaga nivalis]